MWFKKKPIKLLLLLRVQSRGRHHLGKLSTLTGALLDFCSLQADHLKGLLIYGGPPGLSNGRGMYHPNWVWGKYMYIYWVLPKNCKGGSWRLMKGPYKRYRVWAGDNKYVNLKTYGFHSRSTLRWASGDTTQPVWNGLAMGFSWMTCLDVALEVCNTLTESNITPENRPSHPKKSSIPKICRSSFCCEFQEGVTKSWHHSQETQPDPNALTSLVPIYFIPVGEQNKTM